MGITYKTCLCEGCKIYRKEKGVPDPVNAYEERVSITANELAMLVISLSSDSNGITAEDELIQSTARSMVAEKRDSYNNGYLLGCGTVDIVDNDLLNKALIMRGLVPVPDRWPDKALNALDRIGDTLKEISQMNICVHKYGPANVCEFCGNDAGFKIDPSGPYAMGSGIK